MCYCTCTVIDIPGFYMVLYLLFQGFSLPWINTINSTAWSSSSFPNLARFDLNCNSYIVRSLYAIWYYIKLRTNPLKIHFQRLHQHVIVHKGCTGQYKSDRHGYMKRCRSVTQIWARKLIFHDYPFIYKDYNSCSPMPDKWHRMNKFSSVIDMFIFAYLFSVVLYFSMGRFLLL